MSRMDFTRCRPIAEQKGGGSKGSIDEVLDSKMFLLCKSTILFKKNREMEKKRLQTKVGLSLMVFVLCVVGVIVVTPLSTPVSVSKGGGQRRYFLEKYFPMEEGITWNYLQTYADGHTNYEVFCVGGTEAVDGGVADKKWEFDSGESTYGYNCMAWTKEGLMLYNGVSSDGSYSTFEPPAMILPRLIRVGETFEHTGTRTEYDAGGGIVGTWPFSMELTLDGEEDVEVLAGRFTGCLKFSGTENDEGEESEVTLWLASGIGDVKRGFSGDEERELISFTDRNTTYHPND